VYSFADLFDQAIVMSGNAIAPYNEVNRNPLDLARRHANEVGIVGSESLSTKDLVDELRKIDASLLIDVTERLKVRVYFFLGAVLGD
jgi:hypothetical protein